MGLPEDVAFSLSYAQIRAYIRGYRKRERTSWYQLRWQTWAIVSALGAKIDSPEQLLPLPFDREQTAEEKRKDEENLQRLIAECQEHNRQLETDK